MKEIHYIQQPTEYLCGQACVAMIANVSVDDVIRVMNNDQATGKKDYDPEFGFMDELYCKAKVQSCLELFTD